MIESIQLKNFQSHKDSLLKFSPGVNVITGTSDSGKTAIIRALRWIAWNRPLGSEMISNWSKQTEVEITLSEGSKIIRTKDSKDEYKLIPVKGSALSFKAFRTEVPIEILEALNLTEINLQGQLDAPFLLSKSPGEVANHFNSVAALDKISSSESAINKWIMGLRSDIKYKSELKEEYEEKLKTFDFIPKLEAHVEVLEDMTGQVTTIQSQITKVTSLINKITKVETQIKEKAEVLKIETPLNEILEKVNEKKEITKQGVKLKGVIVQLRNINSEIETNEELVLAYPSILKILELFRELNTEKSRQKTLNTAVSSLNDINVRLLESERKYTALQSKFETEMGAVCILCGSKLK